MGNFIVYYILIKLLEKKKVIKFKSLRIRMIKIINDKWLGSSKLKNVSIVFYFVLVSYKNKFV